MDPSVVESAIVPLVQTLPCAGTHRAAASVTDLAAVDDDYVRPAALRAAQHRRTVQL